jgi:HEAT repeat protein
MSKHDTSPEVGLLVGQLSSKDMFERMKAREALVELGTTAVPAVAALADATDGHVRWECAKTLYEIADPSSVDTLIRLLEDSEEGTRWDAALGLIAIGKPSVAPLLKAIIHRSVDYTIFAGARHVMHEFSKTD